MPNPTLLMLRGTGSGSSSADKFAAGCRAIKSWHRCWHTVPSSNPADPTSWYRLPRGEKAGPGEMTRTRMVGIRPTYVWDVSATDGPDIPGRPLPVLLKGQAPPGLREGLVAEIEGKGFTVVEVPDAASISGANGLTDFTAKTVSYRVDVDDSSQVRTLSHDLLTAPTRPLSEKAGRFVRGRLAGRR